VRELRQRHGGAHDGARQGPPSGLIDADQRRAVGA
jgi:hypothetical protein